MKFLLNIFFTFSIILSVTAQPLPDKPRLVIGIMIDGLQQQHIQQLRTRFGQEGLRKLTNDGAVMQRFSCNTVSAGNASDITSLLTGTVPYYHGVISNQVFNRNSGVIQSVFDDKSQSGIETNLKLSALNMKSSHLVDELMMNNPGNSKSFVVALNPEDAIALGGHTATGVVWMNDVILKWSTTNYYTAGLPWQALDMNSNNSFNRYGSQAWTPLYDPKTYLAATKQTKAFEYQPLDKKHGSTSTIIKNTPAANALVAELGLRILSEENLGKDNYTDMLMLQFTVRTPNEKKLSLQSIEKEDIYLRLDAEIQFLMQKIESRIGTGQVLFVLFGNQTNSWSPDELKDNNMYAGYFNASRSMALLSSYLMAVYGPEKWILGYYGKNIYLNRKKIEDSKLNLYDFQRLVADFMMEFEGVQSALTFNSVMNQSVDYQNEQSKIRNSVYKNYSGDVILNLMPGWLEVDDSNNPVGESSALISNLPVFLYGWKIAPQIIDKQYFMTDLSTTLSGYMGISTTNANLGKPIEMITK